MVLPSKIAVYLFPQPRKNVSKVVCNVHFCRQIIFRLGCFGLLCFDSYAQGKHSEAVQLLERALGIRKAELGDQHEATATLKHLLDNDCHSGSGKDEAALSVV